MRRLAIQAPPARATTNMDILVAKIKADKKLLVAETVGLTDAEGKAFWPIYDACQTELGGINNRLKNGITAYATDFNAGASHMHAVVPSAGLRRLGLLRVLDEHQRLTRAS